MVYLKIQSTEDLSGLFFLLNILSTIQRSSVQTNTYDGLERMFQKSERLLLWVKLWEGGSLTSALNHSSPTPPSNN